MKGERTWFYLSSRRTPFAADSGFAACGYVPRASEGFGRRRCLACAAAAAKINRWAAESRERRPR